MSAEPEKAKETKNTVAAASLNACIVGGASSSACTQLYTSTSVSGATQTNTLDAMVNLARHPATNAAAIYTQSTASAAFAPALTAAPADWTMFVSYGGGGLSAPAAVALDSSGNVWVTNYSGAVSKFTNTGVPVYASGITGYNLNVSYGAAIDVLDNVWITRSH